MCASPRADPPRVAGAAVANSSRCFGIGATTRMLGISLVTHRQTTAIKAASCMCRLLRAGRRDWRHTCRLPAAPAGCLRVSLLDQPASKRPPNLLQIDTWHFQPAMGPVWTKNAGHAGYC